jgi:hypothetical protein
MGYERLDYVRVAQDRFQLTDKYSRVPLNSQHVTVTTVTLYPTEAAELRRSALLTALEVTPMSRLLVEKRTVSQLANKLYGTRKFITMFTAVCNLPVY